MVQVLTYEQIDRGAWSALVRESETGNWFQSPAAFDFFASMPELFKPFAIGLVKENINQNEHSAEDAAAINKDKESNQKSGDSVCCEQHYQSVSAASMIVSELPSQNHPLPSDSVSMDTESSPSEKTSDPSSDCEKSEKKVELRGVCVGYITQERSKLKQFLTRRAIIIGGPALANDATSEDVQFLMEAVRKELMNEPLRSMSRKHSLLNDGPIYIETRNFNDYSKWRGAFERAGFEYVPHLNFHVDTSSVEVVETNLGKSRKRDIRTSLRDGATIIEKPTLEQVREYYEILEHLYKTRVKTPLFPFSFFEKLWKHKDGRFLLVALNEEIIGGTVCVEQEGKCLYEWFVSGRDGEWKSIFPSSLATYAGIKYAAEHNMPRFDMMGAGKPDEAYGVRDFKAKFGGTEVSHGRFLSITKPLLYKIGVLGVKILKRR